ncbi:hypothetical protein COY90_03870 [Candidatus Roizmanbacteria bacterium CG_4_10_14_0_8_um_filter_39_9]|uniref:L,D-TPase catalytic domain-containing protein n=1 Tax=Candidatus Roizmanbacteria bacterium CG_4_10_14_0_8_um_filter_39_9 TaxID=1974829 RepID=A0A2M7QC79_9BACT|nr:MAG: hypothetical protein COY90_03870 [Candidatus Roizmanbacteria bacterium CG_4_10_14_0_8_um_filter_39_9]
MKKLFILLFFVCFISLFVFLIVSYREIQKKSYKGVYMGRINVENITQKEISKKLLANYQKTFQVKIQDRIYKMSYEQLGILLDVNSGIKNIFEYNNLSFPQNVIKYVRSFSSQKMVITPLVFTQDYRAYIEKTRFDFTAKNDTVTVDNTDKSLTVQNNSRVYQIDGEHLQSLLVFGFGQENGIFEPRLIQLSTDEKQKQLETTNQQIQSYFREPIQIVIQTEKGLQYVHLVGDELRSIFNVAYDSQTKQVSYTHNDTLLTYLLDNKIDPLLTRSSKVDKKLLKSDVLSTFTARSRQVTASTQYIPLQQRENPNTHGEVANRYIEVDVSDQKMFLFDGGILVKSYVISSGLYYPTPRGHFNIMNKALEGYSDIYNVYMPYWMAFYYGWAGGQDAYFGIHELPYWYAGGERKQRPREFLGSPHTGGCISLDIGAAKEVYDFSFVGMDVVVFD